MQIVLFKRHALHLASLQVRSLHIRTRRAIVKRELGHWAKPWPWDYFQGQGRSNAASCVTLYEGIQGEGSYPQVMPELAEATTMSMLGPVTCRAFTVIEPLFPPDELVCWLTTKLMPPGSDTARLGLDTAMD